MFHLLDAENAGRGLDMRPQVEFIAVSMEELDILLGRDEVWQVAWDTVIGEAGQILGGNKLKERIVSAPLEAETEREPIVSLVPPLPSQL